MGICLCILEILNNVLNFSKELTYMHCWRQTTLPPCLMHSLHAQLHLSIVACVIVRALQSSVTSFTAQSTSLGAF